MGFGTPDPASFPHHFAIDYVRLYQDTRAGRAPRLSCDPRDHPTKSFIERNHLDYGVTTDSPGVYLPLWLTVFLICAGALCLGAGSLEASKLVTCGQAAGCALIFLWWISHFEANHIISRAFKRHSQLHTFIQHVESER